MTKQGRPRKPLDALALAQRLAAKGASNYMLAEAMGIDESTLRYRLKQDDEFSRAIKAGRAQANEELYDWQRRAAANGNPALLIWLGKQNLKQREPAKDEQPPDDKELPQLSQTQLEHQFYSLIQRLVTREEAPE